MPDIQWTGDSSSLESSAKKVAAKILEIKAAEIEYIQTTAILNKQEEKTITTFKKLVVELKTGERFLIQNVEAGKASIIMYKGLSAAQKQAADSTALLTQRQKEAKAVSATISKDVQRNITPEGIQAFGPDFKNSVGRLKEFVEKNKLSVDEIRAIWKDLGTGVEQAYVGPKRRLQALLKDVLEQRTKILQGPIVAKKQEEDLQRFAAGAKVISSELVQELDLSKIPDLLPRSKIEASISNLAEFMRKNEITAERVKEIWNKLNQNITLGPDASKLDREIQTKLLRVQKAFNTALAPKKTGNQTEEQLNALSAKADIIGREIRASLSQEQLDLIPAKTLANSIGRIKEFVVQNGLDADKVRTIWNNVRVGNFSDTLIGDEHKVQNYFANMLTNYDRVVKKQKEQEAKQAEINALNTKFTQEAQIAAGVIRQGYKTAGINITPAIEKNILALQEFIVKNRISAREVTETWQRVRINKIIDTAGTNNQLQRMLITMNNAATGANKLGQGFKFVSLRLESLVRLLLVQQIHRFVATLSSAVYQLSSDAEELSVKIGEIKTISDESISEKSWLKELSSLSQQFGIETIDQAIAAYEALSNQIGNGLDTLKFLTEANKFAITTNSTTTESVDLLSSAINAFRLSLDDTTEIAAKFFKLIDLGRVRATEMSETFGQIAVPANLLGISLDELSASLSVGTRYGIRYKETATLIRNVILKTIRPSEEMKKLFRDIGVESGEAAIKTYGWAGFLSILEERTKGSSDELGELFQRVRAIVGAMLFSGEGLKAYNKDLEQFKNANIDYGKAAETVLDNTGRKARQLKQEIKTFFRDIFGTSIVATEAAIYDLTREFPAIVNEFSTILQKDLVNNQEITNKATSNYVDALKLREQQSTQHIAKIQGVLFKLEDAYTESFDTIYTVVKENLGEVNSEIDKNKKELIKGVEDIFKEIFNIKTNYQKNIFDFRIEDLDIPDKIKKIDAQIKLLSGKNRQFVVFGDKQSFDNTQQEIYRLFDLKKKLSDESVEYEKRNAEKDSRIKKQVTTENIKYNQQKQRLEAALEKATTRNQYSKQADIQLLLNQLEEKHQVKLDQITENYLKINKTKSITIDYEKEYLKLTQQEIRDRQRLALIEIKTQQIIKTLQFDFETNLRRIKEFSFAETSKLDPSDRIKVYNEQINSLTKLMSLQQQYHITTVNTAEIQSKLAQFRNMKQLEYNKQQLDNVRNTKSEAGTYEQLQKRLEDLNRVRNETISIIASVNQIDTTQFQETLNAIFSITKLPSGQEVGSLRSLDIRNKTLSSFKNLQSSLASGDSKQAATNIITLISTLKSSGDIPEALKPLTDSLSRLLGIFEDINPLKEQNNQINNLQEQASKILEIRTQEVNRLQQQNIQLEAQINKEKQISEAIKSRQDYQSQQQQVNLVNLAAFTALQGLNVAGRATGGSIGTDRIVSMLSPGEFVVNSRSAKGFYDQLVGINNRGFQTGGSVTNSFGDMNVSIHSSGNEQIDAIKVVKAINREIRRGTVQLRTVR